MLLVDIERTHNHYHFRLGKWRLRSLWLGKVSQLAVTRPTPLTFSILLKHSTNLWLGQLPILSINCKLERCLQTWQTLPSHLFLEKSQLLATAKKTWSMTQTEWLLKRWGMKTCKTHLNAIVHQSPARSQRPGSADPYYYNARDHNADHTPNIMTQSKLEELRNQYNIPMMSSSKHRS